MLVGTGLPKFATGASLKGRALLPTIRRTRRSPSLTSKIPGSKLLGVPTVAVAMLVVVLLALYAGMQVRHHRLAQADSGA